MPDYARTAPAVMTMTDEWPVLATAGWPSAETVALAADVLRMGRGAGVIVLTATNRPTVRRIGCMYCGNTGTANGAPCPVCRGGGA